MIRVKYIFHSIILISILVGAQNQKKDCVICHASWGDSQLSSTLMEIETHHSIEGRMAFVSTDIMCYSCHDGYIAESRQYFISNDHHSIDSVLSGEKTSHLPLNNKGEMYCGTCHTPHTSPMIETVNYAPFIREELNESQLCISCHENQTTKHFNHPIHVMQESFPSELFQPSEFSKNVECLSCHEMHNPKITKLIDESDHTPLCISCHSDYEIMKHSDHDFQNKDLDEYKGMCTGCHVPHGAKDEKMWAYELNDNSNHISNRFCTECHSPSGIGKEKVVENHGHPTQSKLITECSNPILGNVNDELSCTSCHNPHIWGVDHEPLTEINEEGNALTSFLKQPDDEDGTLCVSCHHNESAITLSDHSAQRDGFLSISPEYKNGKGQCSICHDTHSNNYSITSASSPVSETTSLCLECHTNTEGITNIGNHSHPIGVEFLSTSSLKSVNDSQNIMGCETCHDPHQWGVDIAVNNGHNLNGDGYSSFLKIPISPNASLCLDCHPEQQIVQGTEHDMTQLDHESFQNTCDGCHNTHNAKTSNGILSQILPGKDSDAKRHCTSCHNNEGLGKSKVPEVLDHPVIYSHKMGEQNIKVSNLEVDCLTCHDPHQWSYQMALNEPSSSNIEGNYKTSFLKNPSHESSCVTCHDKETLWKYNYFHNENKRKKY